jgi:hypothetical protein
MTKRRTEGPAIFPTPDGDTTTTEQVHPLREQTTPQCSRGRVCQGGPRARSGRLCVWHDAARTPPEGLVRPAKKKNFVRLLVEG